MIRRGHAGQPEIDEILRGKDLPGTVIKLRLLAFHPGHLEPRPGRRRHVPRQAHQRIAIGTRIDLRRDGRRAFVAPELDSGCQGAPSRATGTAPCICPQTATARTRAWSAVWERHHGHCAAWRPTSRRGSARPSRGVAWPSLWGCDAMASTWPSSVRTAARLLCVPTSMARKASRMRAPGPGSPYSPAFAFAPWGVVTQKYSSGWLYGLRVVWKGPKGT